MARFWVILLICLLWAYPSQANLERQPLTLELLQERINHPVTLDGRATIDLRQLEIDFDSATNDLRAQFFPLLQNRFNRVTTPIGLDFSDSLIEGNFNFRELGLPTRLVKGALPQVLTLEEQQQLEQDLDFSQDGGQKSARINVFRGSLKLNNTVFTGRVDFSKMFFLRPLEAIATQFSQSSLWQETRFGRKADFSQSIFGEEAEFSQSAFLGEGKFVAANFRGKVNFEGATFKDTSKFDLTQFDQLANFTGLIAFSPLAFKQAIWRDRVLFSKSRFLDSLSLAGSTFEKSVSFRSSRFSQTVDLQDVKLLGQADFGNTVFFPYASLNLAGLAFDSEQSKILGETGVIGRVFTLSKLAGNEAVVRDLVRNFRDLEQIPDANAIEYKAKTLELEQLARDLLQFPLRVPIADELATAISLLFLTTLLLLSNYGTNLTLIWGVGIVAIAFFGALFWAIDRWRKRGSTPILPNRYDSWCVAVSFLVLTALGLANILKASDHALLTLVYLSLLLLPLPLGLTARLYLQGRFHDGMDSSYFLLDGSTRELRLLIVRFPVVPEFPLFRDRYTPFVWTRRWNWLNYFDFSCNNLLKIGCNDIRLRDRNLPAIVSILAWYQWGLGLLYISLLLWTLSRTIPGLNLLIYLK